MLTVIFASSYYLIWTFRELLLIFIMLCSANLRSRGFRISEIDLHIFYWCLRREKRRRVYHKHGYFSKMKLNISCRQITDFFFILRLSYFRISHFNSYFVKYVFLEMHIFYKIIWNIVLISLFPNFDKHVLRLVLIY